MTTAKADLLSTTGASHKLGVSAPTVHALVERGVLRCQRTATGQRIFRAADVDKLAAERAAERPVKRV